MAIIDSPTLVLTKYGQYAELYSQALLYYRDPTSEDVTIEGRTWLNLSTNKMFILVDASGVPTTATWVEIADDSSGATAGQVKIGSNTGDPAWANITSSGGTCVITNGDNTINIEATGGTVSSFPCDSGTANPALGVTQMAGGTNISSVGLGSTVTFNLDANPSVAGSLTAGTSVTASDSLTMSAGTMTITADDNAGQDIYLHADGGVTETIEIYADQGTDPASIYIHSDDGGLTLDSGLASADAINITASDAAGGIDVDYGTGGMAVTGANGAFTLATGTGAISLGADAAAKALTIGNSTGATSVAVNCGTGGASFGASASAHATVIGSTNTTSSTTIQSGTGDVVITSTDAITADCAGVLELNSSAGVVSICNDAVNQNLNLGTAGNRTITLGVIGGTTSLLLNAGSDITTACDGTIDIDSTGAVSINSTGGALNLGDDADSNAVSIATAGDRVITIGVTGGTSTLDLAAGTSMATSCDGTIDIDCAGALSLNSSAGVINIANDAIDQNVSIATAGNRVVTIGVIGGTSGLSLNAGSGNIATACDGTIDIDCAGALSLNSSAGVVNIANDAIDQNVSIATAGNRAVTIGATGGTSALDLKSGSSNMTLASDGTLLLDCAGVLELNSSAGVISIASDNVNQNLNLGTAGERVITIGNVSGATGLALNAGTAGIALASTSTGDITIDSDDTLLLDADGVLELNSSAGVISIGNDADDNNIGIGTAGNRTITLGVTGGSSALNLNAGSGSIAVVSEGTTDIDSFGAIAINSSGGAINIGNDANAQAVNICTGAAARLLTLGTTNTVSSTTIQAGSAGIALNAAGITTVEPDTATNAGTSVTINANVGVGTFTGQSTAAAASITLTVTNSVCTATSAILATVSTLGSNDAQLTVNRVKPAAGSFTVQCTNNGSAALNGDIILTFWIIA